MFILLLYMHDTLLLNSPTHRRSISYFSCLSNMDKVSCSRKHPAVVDKARTRDPTISGSQLYLLSLLYMETLLEFRFFYPTILNGGVLCYHFVRRMGGRADGVHKFDHLYLGHHLTNPYGPSYMYVVWTKFCVSCIFWSPPPSVLPGGHKGRLSRFQHDNWSQN